MLLKIKHMNQNRITLHNFTVNYKIYSSATRNSSYWTHTTLTTCHDL